MWVDDPNFNLEYHLRHTGLPAPGSEEQLRALAARIHSQRLDRTKPLWELWLVQGLEDGRFAPDLQDPPRARRRRRGRRPGDGAVRPRARPAAAARTRASRGCRSPSRAAPRWRRAESAGWPSCRSTSPAARSAPPAARAPRCTPRAKPPRASPRSRGPGLNPAPETPLNVPIGPHRRFATVRGELADFKLVKNAFGGTVNDVVLAIVAGALRALAAVARRAHGGARAARARPGLDPRRRRARPRSATGSPSCAGRCPSTSMTRSPAWRRCGRRWTGSRSQSRRSAPRCSTSVQNLAPPTVLAQASRMNFSTRLFNLLVTNVPGPQFPLYALGRELEELFPVAFLPRQPRARRRDHLLQRRHRLRAARRLRRDARPRAVRRLPRGVRGRSWWISRRRRRRTASGLVAQGELRVLGHLLRRPRRREDHVRARPRHARRPRPRTPPSARRPAGRSGRPAW